MARWLADKDPHGRSDLNEKVSSSETLLPEPLVQFNEEVSDPSLPELLLQLQEEVDELGDELLPMLQASRAEREKRECQEAMKAEELEQFEIEIRAKVGAEVERHEAALIAGMQENHVKLQVLEEKVTAISAEAFTIVKQLKKSIKELNEEKRRIQEAKDELFHRADRTEKKITALEISTQELKAGVNALNERINQRENDQQSSLLITVIVVAVCIILDKMAPGSGQAVKAAVTPVAGGAKAGVTASCQLF